MLAAAFTLFQPLHVGADYAHYIGMSQPTFKPFRRACAMSLKKSHHARSAELCIGH